MSAWCNTEHYSIRALGVRPSTTQYERLVKRTAKGEEELSSSEPKIDRFKLKLLTLEVLLRCLSGDRRRERLRFCREKEEKMEFRKSERKMVACRELRKLLKLRFCFYQPKLNVQFLATTCFPLSEILTLFSTLGFH
ncbi:hypothetical protein LR48_Vigan01g007000 [Vigna angularis]|uniref:Uncharacterized protein n=1 Tax=Phaseolus angularis TaxID=3914 RepID=A0A0L9TJ75_PHAAN|nr:hypothetical protein LR48_Vigan01g007000 [Vigna angularis]